MLRRPQRRPPVPTPLREFPQAGGACAATGLV
jgi:hypothetical protein